VPRHEPPGQARIREQRGPEHDSLGSGREGTGQRVLIPQAARHLARDPTLQAGPHDRGHRHRLRRATGQRAVEVDDMQQIGALACPPSGRRSWILVVHAGLRRIAVPEAHDAAAQEVDRRDKQE
jgi:hypothetical protein